MKRLIAVVLTVLTLVSVIPLGVSSAETMPFKDVKSTHWFYNAVKYTYDRGIFSANNSAGDLFGPNVTMTRGMFVTVLFRLSGADQSAYTGETVFTDVPMNQWYAKAVEWANKEGFVAGMTETTFSPNGKITRAQMARILSLYAAKQDGYDLTDVRATAFDKFADAGKVQAWAKEGITWMSTTGLINGMGTENGAPVLDPNGNATRAQAAQILMSYMEYNNSGYPVGSLTLGGTDVSEFSIVYGETVFGLEGVDCSEIADFINGQLKAALGVELPVYRDTEHPYAEGAKEILIGRTDREGAAVTVDRDGIGDNSYIYEMKGDFLILASNEETYATYYAATMFLEDVLGVKYYGLDRFGYTNMKSASIADGVRVTDTMDFDYASNWQVGGEDPFLGSYEESEIFLNMSHALPALACIDEECPYYSVDTLSYAHHLLHEQSFDGCFSDPVTIDRVIGNVAQLLADELGDNKDAYAAVWINQSDSGSKCTCDDCRLVYGLWGRSATYVHMQKCVANAFSNEYPNVKFVSFSYMQTATAPKSADMISDSEYNVFLEKFGDKKYIPEKDMSVPDNCVVMVKSDDTGCSSHPRNDQSCTKNVKYSERIEGWCKLCNNVSFHHFTEANTPFDPLPNVYELWADYDFISDYENITWIRTWGRQGKRTTDFRNMRTYLISRLYWDKDMSFDRYSDILNDYLMNEYGDGWTYIREYIDTMETLSSENHWWTYEGDNARWDNVITEAQWRDGSFEYLRELLYKARELAFTEEQKLSASRLTLTIDFVECQLAYREGAADFSELSTAFTQKLTELGYEIPENWTPDLDPDKWEY